MNKIQLIKSADARRVASTKSAKLSNVIESLINLSDKSDSERVDTSCLFDNITEVLSITTDDVIIFDFELTDDDLDIIVNSGIYQQLTNLIGPHLLSELTNVIAVLDNFLDLDIDTQATNNVAMYDDLRQVVTELLINDVLNLGQITASIELLRDTLNLMNMHMLNLKSDTVNQYKIVFRNQN